ncbi:hypothetical protein T484DRAFT_1937105 [Baffinella frigidus]|nr:hypothetical protein T484DRAFT_1937105 [Cryptophyta sp. CCMP2293]
MGPPAKKRALRGPELRRGKRARKEGGGHVDSADGDDFEEEERAPVRRPVSTWVDVTSTVKRAKTSKVVARESKQLGDALEGYEWGSEDSPWLHLITKTHEDRGQECAQLQGTDGVFSITNAHFRAAGPLPRIPKLTGSSIVGGAHGDNAGGASARSSRVLAPQWPGHTDTGPPLDAVASAQLMVRLFRRSDAPPHASDLLHRVVLRDLLRARRSPAYRAQFLAQEAHLEAPRENTGPRECMDVSAKTLRAVWSEQPVIRRGAPRLTEEALDREAPGGHSLAANKSPADKSPQGSGGGAAKSKR